MKIKVIAKKMRFDHVLTKQERISDVCGTLPKMKRSGFLNHYKAQEMEAYLQAIHID